MKGMIVILTFVVASTTSSSCSEDNVVMTKRFNTYSIKAKFSENNTIEGKAEYYNLSDKLIALLNYKNGRREGAALNFYLNGQIKDSLTFIDNRENGYWYHYDSLGVLSYVDFYYYGLRMGPQNVIVMVKFKSTIFQILIRWIWWQLSMIQYRR